MSAEDTRILRSYVVGHTKGEAALARLEARIAEQHELILRGQTREAEILRLEARVEALSAALREIAGTFNERDIYREAEQQRAIARAALATSEQARTPAEDAQATKGAGSC